MIQIALYLCYIRAKCPHQDANTILSADICKVQLWLMGMLLEVQVFWTN